MICPKCGGDSFKHNGIKYSRIRDTHIRYFRCRKCGFKITEKVEKPGIPKTGLDIVINDIHFPFEDEKLLAKVTSFIVEIRPDRIFLNGDIMDCAEISSYDKSPITTPKLMDEINITRAWLDNLRTNNPSADIYYIFGNHEARFQRFLIHNARQLVGMPGLSLEEQLRLNDLNIKIVNSDLRESFLEAGNGLLIGHFDLVRKNSAYTARALVERFGNSLIQGHVHRVGLYAHTVHGRTLYGYENGCLCDTSPPYLVHPDWQQGFSVIAWQGDDWQVQQIPGINGKFYYAGWH